MTSPALRLGISRCLLGEQVRFDGGHKRDQFLTEVLGRYVEWVPVCPEVEAGLGTPREAMRLVGNPLRPSLVSIKSGQDHTLALEVMTNRRLADLEGVDLSGFVFKKILPVAEWNVSERTMSMACPIARAWASSREPSSDGSRLSRSRRKAG